MKKLITGGLAMILVLMLVPARQQASPHKFYVSIAQMDVNPETHQLEISVRLFTHDMEETLLAEKGVKLLLGADKEYPQADSLIAAYLKAALGLEQEGKALTYKYIGKEIEADVTWIYLESDAGIFLNKPVEIRNTILFERFPDQKNIVNLRYGKESASEIHTKSHPSYPYLLKNKS